MYYALFKNSVEEKCLFCVSLQKLCPFKNQMGRGGSALKNWGCVGLQSFH